MLSRWKWRSIPDIKIIKIEEERNFPFTTKGIYHIEVNDGLDSWVTIRKYDEFLMIHQYVHSLNIPFKDHLILPPKIGVFSKSDESIIQKNISRLESYIKLLIYVPEILHSTEFRNFLIPADYQSKRIDYTNLFILPTPPKDLNLPKMIKLVGSTETPEPERTSVDNEHVFYLDHFLEAVREQLLFISKFKIKIESSEDEEELSPKFLATLSSMESEIKELNEILLLVKENEKFDKLTKYLIQCYDKLKVAFEWAKDITEKIEEKGDLDLMKWITNIDELEKDVQHLILENNILPNKREEMLNTIQDLKSKVSVNENLSITFLNRLISIETTFKECTIDTQDEEYDKIDKTD